MQKVFNLIVEGIAWLLIVASPLLVSAFVAGMIYLPEPSTARLVIACIIICLGLIIGIVWATLTSKKNGAQKFLARTMHTPESDKKA